MRMHSCGVHTMKQGAKDPPEAKTNHFPSWPSPAFVFSIHFSLFFIFLQGHEHGLPEFCNPAQGKQKRRINLVSICYIPYKENVAAVHAAATNLNIPYVFSGPFRVPGASVPLFEAAPPTSYP